MSPPGSRTSTTRYRLAPDVRFRVVGDEGVVVRQDAGEVLVVNGVAARVLELLDPRRRTESASERAPVRDPQGRSVNELIRRLGEEYEASEEEIARDLREFLVEAVAGGIVETLEQAAEP
jgi:hypothetical protein